MCFATGLMIGGFVAYIIFWAANTWDD